ncbi:MAG: succinylglutamate desuccinylase/aspartoacylase family protein, partial [Rivularia sp. ALOHA_DT_140]|nr:succinylglutamate desuccinylase/aspartoacylase family protein [Rivularia sp. ALOHA_DT_140]
DVLSLQVYKFTGASPGKKVYIQSNLHGAEIVGNGVIHQLIEFLWTLDNTDLVGEIWLLPVCNPMGTNQRSHHFSSGRHCAYEAKDWNRIFWDYEKDILKNSKNGENPLLAFAQSQLDLSSAEIRSNFLDSIKQKFLKLSDKVNSDIGIPYTEKFRYKLQSLSLDADYLIDVHSSTNQGLNYLYYFCDREESAKYFLLDFGILLDEYDGDAFDEAFIKPWLALENCFQQLGRTIKFDVEAWTLELGRGMAMIPDSVMKGFEGIKNYLKQKGVLSQDFELDDFPQLNSEMNFKTKSKATKYYATVGGMIQSRIALGTEVKVGEQLYQILSFNKQGKLPTTVDIFSHQDGFVYDISANQSVNEGEFVLGII